MSAAFERGMNPLHVDVVCHKGLESHCVARYIGQNQKNIVTPKNNQPTNQPTNQATKQPSNQATKQPSNQATKQPSNQPTNQPTNQPNNETTNHTKKLNNQTNEIKLTNKWNYFKAFKTSVNHDHFESYMQLCSSIKMEVFLVRTKYLQQQQKTLHCTFLGYPLRVYLTRSWKLHE